MSMGAGQRRTTFVVQNYLSDEQQSMLRFGEALSSALEAQGLRIKVWRPRRIFGNAAKRSMVSKWLAYVDKFIVGIPALFLLRVCHPNSAWHIVDHSNAGYAVVLPWKRLTITCHDCIAIDEALTGRTGEPVGLLGPLFQRWILWGIKRARHIVAVSQATARDLARLGVESDRISVIYNGMVIGYSKQPPAKALELLETAGVPTDRPFVFMVGSNLLRKNRTGAVRIFENLRRLSAVERRLVLAGKPWSEEVRAVASASEFSHDIVEAGTLSDSALEAAYSCAEAVIFPSLAEGFGLPVIEGQSCGALVVTSNIQPLPEIGGSGARYADPLNPREFAEEILRSVDDPVIKAAALENAKRFSAARMGQQYRDLLWGSMRRKALLVTLLVAIAPWSVRRWLLNRILGYRISASAHISRLSLMLPDELVMDDGARISAFNVAVNVRSVVMGRFSSLGRRNWITGHPATSTRHFQNRASRDPSLVLGEHAAVTKGHILDCTDKISIGAFSTIAGYASQLITHGIDYETGRQDCQPINIGEHCLIGTRVSILGGSLLPSYCVLGAGSVLRSRFDAELRLYAGVPAKATKELAHSCRYFTRNVGFVD